MEIREAIGSIIGQRLADNIIESHGVHWAVVAAMLEGRLPRDTAAVGVINEWRAQQSNNTGEGE